MGAFASGIRDLVLSFELGPVTVVGPFARRRGGDAVLLPVPRAGAAPGAGVERRARAQGERPAPRGDVPGLGARAARARRPPRAERRPRRGADARGIRDPARQRRDRDGPGPRLARGSPEPRRVRPHAARERRRRRPARPGRRPPVSRGRVAAADRVGGARPDHPGRPRPPRAPARARQPVRAVRARRPLPVPRRARAVRGHDRGLDRHDRAGAGRRGAVSSRQFAAMAHPRR